MIIGEHKHDIHYLTAILTPLEHLPYLHLAGRRFPQLLLISYSPPPSLLYLSIHPQIRT